MFFYETFIYDNPKKKIENKSYAKRKIIHTNQNKALHEIVWPTIFSTFSNSVQVQYIQVWIQNL